MSILDALMIILGVVAALGMLFAVLAMLVLGVLIYKHGKKVKGRGMREVP